MEADILQELETIRVYVFIIMCAITLWALVRILESLQRIFTDFKKAFDASFENRMNKLLESGQYEEVINESKIKLEKYSNHLNAVWFIARAYFYTENNELAKEYFKKVVYLEPSWEESAKAYILKLNER